MATHGYRTKPRDAVWDRLCVTADAYRRSASVQQAGVEVRPKGVEKPHAVDDLLPVEPPEEPVRVQERRWNRAALDEAVFTRQIPPGLEQVLSHTVRAAAPFADREAPPQTAAPRCGANDDVVGLRLEPARVRIFGPAVSLNVLRAHDFRDPIQADDRVDEAMRTRSFVVGSTGPFQFPNA